MEASTAKKLEITSKNKEAYFTATQTQLVKTRFFKNKSAMIAGSVLIFLIFLGLFSDFLSPYDPTIAGRDKQYENGPPQIPKFWDENGFSFRPFLYTQKNTEVLIRILGGFIKLIEKTEDMLSFL